MTPRVRRRFRDASPPDVRKRHRHHHAEHVLYRPEPQARIPHRRAEVGYALRSDHWGRGLASEAASLAIDWGLRALDLHRIEADIDPRNAASRRLLERLGFRSEGVLRERFFVGDSATDSELFGVLAPEWRARRAQSSFSSST